MPLHSPGGWLRTLTLITMTFASSSLTAAEPLSVRIDAQITAKAKADGVQLGPIADDAEFLRRVSLDLAGCIPTSTTARAFLADTTPNKRAKLIEQLLASPDHPTRAADLLNVMLMERLGDHPQWAKYLRDSCEANRPYDAMVRDMLRGNANEPATAGAAFWLAKRLEHYGQQPVDYSALTRDVGRLFLGKNLQCAECHDHLTIEDYKQRDFQGLHAFFKNAYLVSEGQLAIGEKATTEKTPFVSVFTKVPMATGPALPGRTMLEIPVFPKGMEFLVPPDLRKKEPGVPKFSTLAAAAAEIPRADNADFRRNAANRIWFALVGRGLVHPLDLHHAHNPASHPELLELLADEFAAHKFDIRWLLGEIARSETYQRSSVLAGGAEPPHPRYFAVAAEKRLTAEQLLVSMVRATGADPTTTASVRAKFTKAFANPPREPEEDVTASLKAALFVLHDEAILGLVRAKAGNLTDRVAKLEDVAAADELYLAVLSRKPTADERATVATVLGKHPNQRAEAVGRVVWALIASMEFGVNH